MIELRIIVPFLPPSSNNIYVTDWRRKMRFPTKEAKQFKARFAEEVVPNNLAVISSLDRSLPYSVIYQFYFPKDEVMTKTFGQKGGAASMYKKMDTENRAKLVSDCLSDALGIDDSQFFYVGSGKYNCELVGGTPQTHILIRPESLSNFGF